MAKILSGLKTREQILKELKNDIKILKDKNIIPKLVIIQIGDDYASNLYIKNKIKLSESLGTITILKKFNHNFSEKELIDLIHNLNNNSSINGIILQLPVPPHINVEKILSIINPEKDVDCFNIINVGKL